MQTQCVPASSLLAIVLFIESLNASASINELLLTRKEGMALGADFNLHLRYVLSGAREEAVTASAGDGDFMVIRMNTFFHFDSPETIFYAHTRHLRVYDIKFLYYILY